MSRCCLLLMCGFVMVSGCTWPVRQRTDRTVCQIANQPYDIGPANMHRGTSAAPGTTAPLPGDNAPTNLPPPQSERSGPPEVQLNQAATAGRPGGKSPEQKTNELRFALQDATATDTSLDVSSAAWLESGPKGAPRPTPPGRSDVQKTAWSQPMADRARAPIELRIPARLPGSETPPVALRTDVSSEQAVEDVYPSLPPLPIEPRMLPGPDGRPLSLTELQRIAAANSPALRQAVARVQEARGKMRQARTYANPNASYFVDPNANNTSSGVQGLGIEQVIKTAGKQKLSAAAAQKDYENAQIALKAARNDLATRVRQAYFALLVDKETLAVTRAVARFTDEIYSLSKQVLKGGPVAAYEPAALRAQAFATRLAYQQAIATYIYDWKALVAAIGLHQLPLTEVAGRIDRFIPYYDYDRVLAYVLRNHTDVLTARNLVPQARYNLKLAQVTPIPDLDVAYRYGKDYTAFPFGSYSQFLLSMPLPVWDQNKGNIMAAQGALVRASEEQHNTELDLTNRLADAYTNYQNNLYAIDYYRRYILPDLVRYYRGVYQRRPLDPENVNVGDLAFAQQNLSQNVMAYLSVLGNLWQSVVGVANFLQTDDLFQMASPQPLPELPDFDALSPWACGHPHIAAKCGVAVNSVENALSRRAGIPQSTDGPATATSRNGTEGNSVGNALSRPAGMTQSTNGPAIATSRNATEGIPYRDRRIPSTAAQNRRTEER